MEAEEETLEDQEMDGKHGFDGHAVRVVEDLDLGSTPTSNESCFNDDEGRDNPRCKTKRRKDRFCVHRAWRHSVLQGCVGDPDATHRTQARTAVQSVRGRRL